ncbi:hypothetical protein DY000_02037411 [Brassica cretica]|uniref:Syntaxin N-terminal domain-containing protein n=1 Tax=Brassica cretica TaxID=69181 RepID=A0ABQ7BCN7_BRACR|nr:hypothetical protein DY000_02037411 [Brassica cretica]
MGSKEMRKETPLLQIVKARLSSVKRTTPMPHRIKQKIKDTINRFDKLQRRYIELKNNEMRPPVADEAEVEHHMATHAL